MRIKSILTVILISVFTLGLCISCEEDKLSCEEDNYGIVIVKNNTDTKLIVDVTLDEGSTEKKDKKFLPARQSIIYERVDAGSITVWASKCNDQCNWYKKTLYYFIM